MGMVKDFQSSQNSKFAMSLELSKKFISLQYLKIEIRDEIDFLHAGKHQIGLQVDFNTFSYKVSYNVILPSLMSMMKHSQITQSKKFADLCNISKKLGMQFIFCMQINISF